MKQAFQGFVLILSLVFIGTSASAFDWKKIEADVKKAVKKIETKNLKSTDEVGEKEAASGLKAALSKGAKLASNQLSRNDGYLKNEAIKILFPPEFRKAEKTLRQIGMGSVVDKAIVSFNRSAERAAKKSFPIFKSAITGMSFTDAMKILFGSHNSATTYLKRKTGSELQTAFLPVVQKSADEVLATRYWNDMAKTYNRIPTVKKLPDDISLYITQKAISGLFYRVEIEEKLIRENPISRTSDILRRVFGYADKNK